MTISLAEMPSLVTLVCAAAGTWVSITVPTARPNAINDFDIDVSSPRPMLMRRVGPRLLRCRHDSPVHWPHRPCASRHRALAIHRVDFAGIALVHEIALQLHG